MIAIAPSALLDSLDPAQRAAATLPDGPAQVIAPAGSGKTTTLIARLGVLLGRGVAAERILVVTFNRDAAVELSDRVRDRLVPELPTAAGIEVRTLHALARQVLLDAGCGVRLVADRLPLLRAARRRSRLGRRSDEPPPPDAATLDVLLSLWKIEGRPPAPEAPPALDEFGALLAARGAIDFDDLVVRAGDLLETDTLLRERWQGRFSHLLVDEFQDVDAAQLRLVRVLAQPEDNLVVVGDDDQTIYAWRLADVRRILDFGLSYPKATRIQLATNYRCPPAVVSASGRLIAVNRERFAKEIRAGSASTAKRPQLLAVATDTPDWPDRLVALARAAAAGGSVCFLARTRTELTPVMLALVRGMLPHRTSLPAPVEADPVVALAEALRGSPASGPPFEPLRRLRAARRWTRAEDELGDEDHTALDAFLGWSAGFGSGAAFLEGYDVARRRLAALRDPSAPIELVTVHGAKGREWQTVVVVGFEEDRFPNRRALLGAALPERAIEEERRLAYVALTRARGQLVLAFDPARPSRFLAEMGYRPTLRATTDR
ncbi:MAG: ATP-dependent helicase [Chloroflexota bacterium]|nr:ATP-dependent helicase [Chloroflexota bacterium]